MSDRRIRRGQGRRGAVDPAGAGWQDRGMVRRLSVILPLVLALAQPIPVQAETAPAKSDAPVALTPELLSNALSCRSRDALYAFADALFLDPRPPAWMREMTDDKATKGIAGYRLATPALLSGRQVDRVYFLNDWIVTLWPRKVAEAFIAAQAMKRAPIAATEQYYRFLDPDSGPMLGAFAPTGHATAAMLARAFGAKVPPPPPPDSLFVGCNYTSASEAEFLSLARRASGMAADAGQDVADDIQAIVPPR
ncbi:hypothetical protein [Sphingomonas yabuuchiae]|uniref:hypothetical protein n=1 Tax=Sphingomonas yabuuchiae TaxID=172044 RepID=UPI003D962A84